MSEERKTIYLCLAHMSEAGTEICERDIRHKLGSANGTERKCIRTGFVCFC